MPDLLEIAQAWYLVGHHTDEQKQIADERLAICNGCEEKKHNDVLRFFQCAACGCPIRAKVYSQRGPSACPKKKWAR